MSDLLFPVVIFKLCSSEEQYLQYKCLIDLLFPCVVLKFLLWGILSSMQSWRLIYVWSFWFGFLNKKLFDKWSIYCLNFWSTSDTHLHWGISSCFLVFLDTYYPYPYQLIMSSTKTQLLSNWKKKMNTVRLTKHLCIDFSCVGVLVTAYI